jgi:Sulfite exporter TauE/SafE
MGIMTCPVSLVACRGMANPFLYSLCGLIVGALVGLTGVGGGSLMTPLLMLVFGQSPAIAVGTDLVFSASTKLVATASFGFSRRVDWRIVGRLVIGSARHRRRPHMVLAQRPTTGARGSVDLSVSSGHFGARRRCSAHARFFQALGPDLHG